MAFERRLSATLQFEFGVVVVPILGWLSDKGPNPNRRKRNGVLASASLMLLGVAVVIVASFLHLQPPDVFSKLADKNANSSSDVKLQRLNGDKQDSIETADEKGHKVEFVLVQLVTGGSMVLLAVTARLELFFLLCVVAGLHRACLYVVPYAATNEIIHEEVIFSIGFLDNPLKVMSK
nr:hypothetical protein BaRGS_017848 [Batillaria attramentaria]